LGQHNDRLFHLHQLELLIYNNLIFCLLDQVLLAFLNLGFSEKRKKENSVQNNEKNHLKKKKREKLECGAKWIKVEGSVEVEDLLIWDVEFVESKFGWRGFELDLILPLLKFEVGVGVEVELLSEFK